jgi:hypothetical protein
MEKIEVNDSVNKQLGSIMRLRGANIFKQLYLFHNRSLLQEYRKAKSFLIQLFLGAFGGILLGLLVIDNRGALYKGVLVPPYTLLSEGFLEHVVPLTSLLCGMAISLVASAPGTKTFDFII